MLGVTGMDTSTILERAGIYAASTRFATEIQAINLSQGIPEPFFDNALNRAIADATQAGWQYADPWGEAVLRDAIVDHYQGTWAADQVLVTSGCTESLALALSAAKADYGDQVLYLEPFYSYYPGLVAMAGLEGLSVPLEKGPRGYGVDWQAVGQQFAKGVRILLLNTPHNPSGWVMGEADWRALGQLSEQHGLLTIIDDAYGAYLYTEGASGSAAMNHGCNCVVAGSASKTLSATGLRIGWLAGDRALIEKAYAQHLYLSYCQPRPLQLAAAELLRTFGHFRAPLRERYASKRDRLFQALKSLGLEAISPAGGHYILADYRALSATQAATEFAQAFARRFGVMPLPASPFYRSESIREVRFSFSAPPPVIDSACERLVD